MTDEQTDDELYEQLDDEHSNEHDEQQGEEPFDESDTVSGEQSADDSPVDDQSVDDQSTDEPLADDQLTDDQTAEQLRGRLGEDIHDQAAEPSEPPADDSRRGSTRPQGQHHTRRGERDSRESRDPLRQLPNLDKLLRAPETDDLIRTYGRDSTRDALKIALDAARQWIRQGGKAPASTELISAATSWLRNRFMPTLRPVINATGVILPSNLGRSVLSESAQQMMLGMAASYSSLEYDLEEGKASKREPHIESLIVKVTGAEAALVVNNNAAALMLVLGTLAQVREIIISRGQMIEIGGLRLSDLMVQSGTRIVEVGTTNRTTLDDYAQAITPQTAAVVRNHASNFRQVGFAEQPDLRDLVTLAHTHNLLMLDNLGSGALLDTASYGLTHEPTVQESLEAGVDLVMFSGDKLLGGPQAGIIAGQARLMDRLKRNPFARAVRIDKFCLAGLHATLDHYRRGDAPDYIPVWQMLAADLNLLRTRAEDWARHVGGEVILSESSLGDNNLPGETLPTYVLALSVPQPEEFLTRLRRYATPVIARLERERILLDPRTVLPIQDRDVVRAVQSVLR